MKPKMNPLLVAVVVLGIVVLLLLILRSTPNFGKPLSTEQKTAVATTTELLPARTPVEPTPEERYTILNPPLGTRKKPPPPLEWNRYVEIFEKIAREEPYLELDEECNATPIALLLKPSDALTIKNSGSEAQTITLPLGDGEASPPTITISGRGSSEFKLDKIRFGTITCEKKEGAIVMLRMTPTPDAIPLETTPQLPEGKIPIPPNIEVPVPSQGTSTIPLKQQP